MRLDFSKPLFLLVLQDITVIYRRRGGNDLIQDHAEWKKTVKSNPDVISMTFLSIDMLLESVPAQENLGRAIEAYLTCECFTAK